MKNYKNISVLCVLLTSVILFSGCFSTSSTKKIQDTKDGLAEIKSEFNANSEKKLTEIATISSGTDYSLSKISNPEPEVKTAIDLNSRVINLAGNPNITELEKIKETVDLLTSTIQNERNAGLQQLHERDEKISALQLQLNNIQSRYDNQIDILKKQATQVALKADKYQQTVDEVNSYMGLGAVWYGLKKFVSQGIIIIFICLTVFIVLKFAANSNPIAASIFAIFEYLGGYLISIIKSVVPNSTSCVNLVESKYKTVLTRYVALFEKLKLSKNINDYTLPDIFNAFSNELNREDKNVISELKQDIKNKI